MTREIAHQKSFEKALYAIEPNFPPGKLPGMPQFTNMYFNMSQGEGDMRGARGTPASNGSSSTSASEQAAVDGGDGPPPSSSAQRTRSCSTRCRGAPLPAPATR